MSSTTRRLLPALFLAIAAGAPAVIAATAPVKPAARPAAGAPVFADVRKVLEKNCLACHSGEKAQGGLRLTSRADLLKGGATGPSVRLDRPLDSLVVAAINYRGRRMPPRGKMSPADIEVLTRWVRTGLTWPSEFASLEPKAHPAPPQVTPETMRFWAYQPVTRPQPPVVRNRTWVRTPIDAFVLSRLEQAKLTPNAPIDRTGLIRRAYYDILGLPPTPEEVAAFAADRSPDAWEKVVNRLLSSPQYGEKWGRHWLDLVRYAETNSYERDGPKPEAWRYRDYVINSFNEDKPYDQFVREQIAGDELPDRTAAHLIATGFYRLGIWDDEPADPKLALYDDLDDIVNTTGQVFLGMSLGCARCHDHKIDPLPQRDYYRFLAFFSGVRRFGQRSNESVAEASLRPIAPMAEIEQQRRAVAENQRKLREVQTAMEAIERKILPDLSPVEKEEWQNPGARVPILRKRVPALVTAEEADEYLRLARERRRLFETRPSALASALCVTEIGPRPRDTFVLARGNPQSEGEKVLPGFPSVLGMSEPKIEPRTTGETSGRRTALAAWLTDPRNPLTARVMVNRIWHYHFGKGIVRSVSNFGFQGDRPTHPELLDWLASELMAGGWKMKPIHRLILLSSTYQMSSRGSQPGLARDPENKLMWRFEMRRLLAEEIRDSILAANGSLNLKPGGPSFYPTIPAEILAGQSRPGEGWGNSSPEEQRRRSVYIYVKRSLISPLIAAFDGPETDFTCSARFATTQPTQALSMLNSQFIQDQADVFAAYLRTNAGDRDADQVRLALRRITQRDPSSAEVARGVKLIDRLRTQEKLSPALALRSFCVVALNTNEFLYID